MGEYIHESQDGFHHVAGAVITGKFHEEDESQLYVTRIMTLLSQGLLLLVLILS